MSLESLVPIDNYHPPLLISNKLSQSCNSLAHNNAFWNFKKANLVGIIFELNKINWPVALSGLDINSAVHKFHIVCHDTLTKFVPKIRYTFNSFPIWFSMELKQLIKSKKIVHLKYKKFKNNSYYNKFSNLRLQCKQLSLSCYHNFISKIQLSLVNNPRAFWNFIKARKKTNNFPAVMFLNNKSAQDGPNISNLFVEHFSSIYSNDCPSTDNLHVTVIDSIDLRNITIDIHEVFSALENCGYNCSPGPDGIPETILNQCRYAFTIPIYYFFYFPYLYPQVHFPTYGNRLTFSPFLKTVIAPMLLMIDLLV